MTLLAYTGYECNVNGFHSGLKLMEKIPLETSVTAYTDPISGTSTVVLNQHGTVLNIH